MEKIKIQTEYIKLGQFLKFVGLIDNGGEEKEFLLNNGVLVNGEKEERRGRKLYPGDSITIGNKNYQVD